MSHGVPIADAEVKGAGVRSRFLAAEPVEPVLIGLLTLCAQLCRTSAASLVLVDPQETNLTLPLAEDNNGFLHPLYELAASGTGLCVIDNVTERRVLAGHPPPSDGRAIGFFAGAPVVIDGRVIALLCVDGVVPSRLTSRQRGQLELLAGQVVGHLQLRIQAAQLRRDLAAQLTLASRQRLLQAVADNTDAAIHVKDLDGTYLFANRAMGRLIGRPGTDIVGMSTQDIFPAALAKAFRKSDSDIVASGAGRRSTEQLPHADGALHDFETRMFPLPDEQGRLSAVAGISIDVTEFTQERRRFEESERRWRTLVEHSPVGVAVIGADRRFRYANAPAQRLYGLAGGGPGDGVGDGPAMSIVGRLAADFIPVEALPATGALFAAVLNGDTLLGQRWTLRRADGDLIEAELNAAPIEYEGQPAVQVELRDMSAQIEAERALRDSATRWRTLFDASPVGIVLIDSERRFVSVNAALCTMLGVQEESLLGRTRTDFTELTDGLAGRPADWVAGVLRTETRYEHADGELRWAQVNATRVPGPDGQVWTLAHTQDITDRKLNELAITDLAANLHAVSVVIKRIQTGEDARQTVVQAGVELAQAAYCSLLEPTPDGKTLMITASTSDALLGSQMELSARSVSSFVFRTGDSVFLADPDQNPMVSLAMLRLLDARSLYVLPVFSRDQVSAVLTVGWRHRVNDIDDRRATAVALLADQAGIALRQAALVAELETLALTDSLTNLPNRRSWNERLDTLLSMAHRNGKPLTIALADLDHFKRYNDTFGHPAGDELLATFADAGNAALRAGDAVARWGGEEFAFALPDCPAAEAERVLDRVRQAVPYSQTCSIGYATWDGLETITELMQRADAALYAAKHGGRDQVRAA